ncbi:L-threonylcarbamoyladenylate synthase [Colwellia sp. 4_MG-2023]|jgi:tRNA threonylcarbamoyl adenosine modification protein (Sua5/YciO/YrdC/YwlC family)|uniref:L-threonylcarbamoyladenylate synthase n=1 Tax=unclassified Colwellia TaxID=196834 RepID=UPI001C087732|nr:MULTISPECIES: L-threonylcarbamoyladenylate synthase [unclassified Colwellia]MBU2923995.1 threonylcarbamoyl-AMP synthase [Colwellia sp. C2M11]MDO6488721.1 L-threonylcarbamoyladenylate synthase [Colwellia sp. 6_MG-2023]MDO6507903.1 L-threonylcarbamoyladenylate synthase [Colwellia sp. 5_MG-2023]MDO6556544.1 L-threonylcarbamoyladenylate synthase [Colwellia sp. 4_MG-2023]MDO6653636.1 L-threonylcarbamoyladenylate synthase [Colwellia sp. 3_MG-2023]
MSQFFYVHPETPQGRLMKQAVTIIKDGGVIVYPTDSGYALGCHIGDKKALERICQIRDISKSHNFTLVCQDLSQLSEYTRIDNTAYRLLKSNTPGAYTFIFKGSKEVPKRLLNPKKKTIGIRIPDNNICQALLAELAEPIMSTSLIMPGETMAEFDPEQIRDLLEHQVDLIINGGHLGEHPTTVIDFSNDDIEIIRVGEGDPSPFE